ncbi:hypothetical protein Tco_1449320 [Tanacetum coccineum]
MAEQQEIQQQDRPDEELVPITEQVKIGLNNYRIALEKQEPDVIYKLCLINMRQFWHTVTYNLEATTYFFTLDDQSFKVNADLLHDALQITSKDFDHPFVTPPPHDEIIDSRHISTKKKELLPFPRFTKLIIKHILSYHNIVSKRLQSDKNGIKFDAVLENLKFANKGAKDPIYGMEIPKEMLSGEIKASADYLNYLAKSMGTQPAKGRETGQSEEVVNTVDSKETDEDEVRLNERQTSIIIGLCEGSGVIPKVPNRPSDRSDSLSSKSEDEEGFLSTDDEASQEKSEDERTKVDDSEKAEDVKDADEQARKEQAMDEQAGIDQPGKVQAEVSAPDLQVEKPVTQLLSTSLTLSSTEYGNQFINDNHDASLTDVLKDPTEIEIHSMVDVPIHQKDPAVQIPPLVDTRVTRLEKKVEETSKIDHSKAINKLVQAHLKKVLPTYASDFENTDVPYDENKSYDTHPAHKKLYDALMELLLVDENDMGKAPSKSSNAEKIVNAEESVQDTAVDVEESIRDNVVDVEDPTQEDADANLDNWFNELVNPEKDPKQFDDLMGSTIDFMKFAKNCLKKDKIMKADLEGPTFMLLKGNYKNNIELEYNMEQCYLALTEQLDWANPEGDRCPYDFTKPLSLQGPPGCTTIPVDFFFNKYLEYLKTGNKEKKYASLLTKPKAARYELEGLEEMNPKLWSSSKVQYEKDVALRIHHCGSKRQLFYRARHG